MGSGSAPVAIPAKYDKEVRAQDGNWPTLPPHAIVQTGWTTLPRTWSLASTKRRTHRPCSSAPPGRSISTARSWTVAHYPSA